MLRILQKNNLKSSTIGQLSKYVKEIEAQVSLPEKAKKAQFLWDKWVKANKISYQEVKNAMDKMCPTPNICCYCERNEHSTLSHINPIDLYPYSTFHWENFVCACEECNTLIQNRAFAIFDNQTFPYQLVTSFSKTTNNASPFHVYGEPVVFINIRRENPMDFMELDLYTFLYVPKDNDTNTQNYHRATYTIKTLDLNRKILRDDRAHAYDSFIQKLSNHLKENDLDKRNIIKAEIQNMKQKSVWYEMKRYYHESLSNPKLLGISFIQQINDIFNQITDINTW